MQLLATNSSVTNISATENTSTIEGYMQDFVDSYNNLILNINALNTAGSSLETSGALVSDSTVTRILRTLRAYSSTSITGYEGGPYTMSLLGVATQRDGTLTFNKNTFKNTVAANTNILNAFGNVILNLD